MCFDYIEYNLWISFEPKPNENTWTDTKNASVICFVWVECNSKQKERWQHQQQRKKNEMMTCKRTTVNIGWWLRETLCVIFYTLNPWFHEQNSSINIYRELEHNLYLYNGISVVNRFVWAAISNALISRFYYPSPCA